MNFTQYEIRIKALDEATQTLRRLPEEARKAARGVDQAGGTKTGLRGLKQQLGEESGFGLGVKTLAGAGAVAGLAMAGRLFGDLGESVRDLTREYQEGKINARELATKMVESIPVIGGFARGMTGLIDAIIETTESQKHFRDTTDRAIRADEERIRRREQDKRQAGFDESLAEFGRTDSDDAKGRLNARFRSEMKRFDELEKKGMEIDPTGANMGRVMEQRIAAEEKFRQEFKKLDVDAAKERESGAADHHKRLADMQAQTDEQELRNRGETFEAERQQLQRQAEAEKAAISERFAKISEAMEKDGLDTTSDRLRSAAEQNAVDARVRAETEAINQREKESAPGRIDSSLDKFFKFQDEAGMFDEDRKPERFSARFSSAEESRGTGAGALARENANRDPSIQIAKDSNKTLKDTKGLTEQMAAGIAELVRVAAGGVQAYNGVGNV